MSAAATVFVDRDGVINRKRPEGAYVSNLDEFEPLPGSIEALACLSRAGFKVVVVTNQQGVAKGVTSAAELELVHANLTAQVAAEGGAIDQIQVCPHLAGTCGCRKPKVGLFEQARSADPEISFERAAVVGDSESDIEAAKSIGARALLVSTEPERSARADGVVVVADLASAAKLLIGGSGD